MNFELTEEQNLIRDMVRSFAETEVAPSAAQRDEDEQFDRDLMFGRLGELGLTGIVFPEEYGGAGADYLSYSIAVEELSRVCGSTGVTLSAHLSLGSNPIYLFGNEEQKKTFLTPLAQGETMGAFGLTEPSAGSDTMSMSTHVRTVDGQLTMNGEKLFVNNGEYAPALLVAAIDQDAPAVGGHPALSMWMIPCSAPGITAVPEDKICQEMLPFAHIQFDNVLL